MVDEQILSLLAAVPKKKYLKKVIDVAVCLNSNYNVFDSRFETPITQNIQSDLQINKQQMQRLLLALSHLIEIVCKGTEREKIFSSEFDGQLSELLLGTIESMKEGIMENRVSQLKDGNRLVDMNWRLDLQIMDEKGKKNEPTLIMLIQSEKEGELQREKIGVKGEQFSAFINNFKKIKEQLSKLVEK